MAVVAARAQKEGFERVMLIYERHGNPSELAFIQDGEWLPSITMKNVEIPSLAKKAGRVPQVTKGKPLDEKGSEVIDLLLGAESQEIEAAKSVEVVASKSGIRFEVSGVGLGPVIKIASVVVHTKSSREN